MAVNKSSANRKPDWVEPSRNNGMGGINIDPGPHVGVIKNNVDPSRQGRLAVWIPDIGGDENDATKWYTVRYASPYFGSTLGLPGVEDTDSFAASQQTYGFWAVPPDVGNLVLIVFVKGDPSRGYWFACIPNLPSRHMVPGIARPDGDNIGTSKITQDQTFGAGRITSDSYLPTSELNSESDTNDRNPEFYNLPKVVHTWQANIVINQGLDKDPVRGTITSSSQREAPSYVVGLSSPGRTSPDTADFPNLDELLAKQELKISTVQSFPNRKGGHTFVMDDGDIRGNSQLLRLRSAAGHQILMHDSENIMYIGNSLGTSWIELTPDGSINIFSGGSVNVHALNDLNFHADANINIHSGNTIKMFADKNILMQTQQYAITASKEYSLNSGKIGLQSDSSLLMASVAGGWKTSADLVLKGRKIYLNTTTPEDPTKNVPFEFYQQANVSLNTNTKIWEAAPDAFDSISPITPTHEPWKRQIGQLRKNTGEILPTKPQTPAVK